MEISSGFSSLLQNQAWSNLTFVVTCGFDGFLYFTLRFIYIFTFHGQSSVLWALSIRHSQIIHKKMLDCFCRYQEHQNELCSSPDSQMQFTKHRATGIPLAVIPISQSKMATHVAQLKVKNRRRSTRNPRPLGAASRQTRTGQWRRVQYRGSGGSGSRARSPPAAIREQGNLSCLTAIWRQGARALSWVCHLVQFVLFLMHFTALDTSPFEPFGSVRYFQ